jgi:hypothetical protein
MSELIYGQWGQILPTDTTFKPIWDNDIFLKLEAKPLFAVMSITKDWIKLNESNLLIATNNEKNHKELHSVLIYGCDKIEMLDGPYIHCLNAWNNIIIKYKQFCTDLYNVYDIHFDEVKWLEDGKWREYLIVKNDK